MIDKSRLKKSMSKINILCVMFNLDHIKKTVINKFYKLHIL